MIFVLLIARRAKEMECPLERLIHLIVKHSRAHPSEYTMLYPYLRMAKNIGVHAFHEVIHTFLPAYVADIGLRFLGEKPIMVKVQKRSRDIAVSGNATVYVN